MILLPFCAIDVGLKADLAVNWHDSLSFRIGLAAENRLGQLVVPPTVPAPCVIALFENPRRDARSKSM
jgi:hypothetical protein